MTQPSLISILMPVYNAEPFLGECLDSIIGQTEENWELLAVDDFSEDGSLAVLASYAERDERIRVFKNSSKGIIPALRLALAKSGGGFITRMDADDKMMPPKLAVLKQLLIKNGPGHVATGLVRYFSEEVLGDGYTRYERWLNHLIQSEENYRDIFKECVIPSPCWMTYRVDLIAVGAFAPDIYPEDYDLCFRFYKQGLRVRSEPEVLHMWRDHDQRTSRNDERYWDERYFALKLPYFLELQVEDTSEVLLWGAGRKGKQIARMLIENKRDFTWACNNPRKIGREIYGQTVRSLDVFKSIGQPRVIIAVSNPDDQKQIEAHCRKAGWKAGREYFFFC